MTHLLRCLMEVESGVLSFVCVYAPSRVISGSVSRGERTTCTGKEEEVPVYQRTVAESFLRVYVLQIVTEDEITSFRSSLS